MNVAFYLTEEMTSQRDVPTVPDNSLAAFVTSALPEGESKAEDRIAKDMGDYAHNELKKQESTTLLNVSVKLNSRLILTGIFLQEMLLNKSIYNTGLTIY